MKTIALPQSCMEKLKRIEESEDREERLDILESLLPNDFNMQVLWAFRRYFNEVTTEDIEKRIFLHHEMIILELIKGNLERGRELLDMFPKGGLHYTIQWPLLPDIDDHEFVEAVKASIKHGLVPTLLIVTLGYPSIISGLRDCSYIINHPDEFPEAKTLLCRDYYGFQDDDLENLVSAEVMYQRGEVFPALIKVLGVIPHLKEKNDLYLLFVALALQIRIMVFQGETDSVIPMIDSLRSAIEPGSGGGLEPNIDAFEAWASMLDGDYTHMTEWMRKEAPNEYGEMCMMDTFRYLIKARGYIIYQKYIALSSLCTRMTEMMRLSNRHKDLCEFEMLWAFGEQDRGDNKSALEHFDKAIELAKEFHFDRLLADEGIRMCKLIDMFVAIRGKNKYLSRIREMASEVATIFPRYLRPQMADGATLTKSELGVLRLLADGRSNMEIAEILHISINTVKFHAKNINSKLCVGNRTEAVAMAAQLGILR